jgi:hypothetical protein
MCEFRHARTWELLVPNFPVIEMDVRCTIEKPTSILQYNIDSIEKKSIHANIIIPINHDIITNLNETMFAVEAFCVTCKRNDNSEIYKTTLFHDCRLIGFEIFKDYFKLQIFSLDMEYLN